MRKGDADASTRRFADSARIADVLEIPANPREADSLKSITRGCKSSPVSRSLAGPRDIPRSIPATPAFGQDLLHHVRSRITGLSLPPSLFPSSVRAPPPSSLSSPHTYAHGKHACPVLAPPAVRSSLFLDTCCFSVMQTRACKREARHVIGD